MNLRRLLFKITHWESWHYHLKYIPIAPLWLWYCLKARSLWFFSASNPTITFGGFEGEGKSEIYDQLPEETYPPTAYIRAGTDFEEIKQIITSIRLDYPFVTKPDAGSMGYMFRKIHSEDEWRRYHQKMPFDYIVQDFVDYELEASVFYYRLPNEEKGNITGFLIKTPPVITGDGQSTLEQLIDANYDLRFRQEEMKQKHHDKLNVILKPGERFILSQASNRSQGAKLYNVSHEIDDNLVAVFDRISNYSGKLYYGRWDLKCASIEALKAGREFSILEFNGAGAGIQHVYGDNLNLWQACRTIAQHWKILYQISAINHTVHAVPYCKYADGRTILKDSMRQLRSLERLDKQFRDSVS